MEKPRSSKKIRLSQQQYDRLRIIYAIALATKYYGLKADTLFVHGLNPEWIAQHDVLSITTNLHDENKMLNQLFETGKVGDVYIDVKFFQPFYLSTGEVLYEYRYATFRRENLQIDGSI